MLPHPGDPLTIRPTGEALVYYANVEENEGKLSTLTSRTLAFVGIGPTLEEAERIAEQAASAVRGRSATGVISAPGHCWNSA